MKPVYKKLIVAIFMLFFVYCTNLIRDNEASAVIIKIEKPQNKEYKYLVVINSWFGETEVYTNAKMFVGDTMCFVTKDSLRALLNKGKK